MWNEKANDKVIYPLALLALIPLVLFCILVLAKPGNFEALYGLVGRCAFFEKFHFYCPGCGGGRALRALTRGNLWQAFWLHPGAVYGIFFYGIYVVTQTLNRLSQGKIPALSCRPIYLFVMAGLIFVNVLVRNGLLLFFQIPTL